MILGLECHPLIGLSIEWLAGPKIRIGLTRTLAELEIDQIVHKNFYLLLSEGFYIKSNNVFQSTGSGMIILTSCFTKRLSIYTRIQLVGFLS